MTEPQETAEPNSEAEPSLFWADLDERLKHPEFRRAYIAAAIRFEITDRMESLPDKLREKATSLGLALLCEAAFEGKATAAQAEALAVIVMDLLALGGELDTRAGQAEAAIERARALADKTLPAWRSEYEFHQKRAERNGYALDKARAEAYECVIEALTQIRDALDQPEEGT